MSNSSRELPVGVQLAQRTLNRQSNAGFTLIELMISIVLGLLLVAAAIQLITGGVISTRLQQAGGDLQDNGLFGMNFMTREFRLANFGNINNRLLTDIAPWGGIVLSADTSTTPLLTTLSSKVSSNLPSVRTSAAVTDYIPAGLLSNSDGDTVGTGNQWTGASNVQGVQSDQLTIQYSAPVAMQNCEGTTVAASTIVVERYFLRLDTINDGSGTGAVKNLVLACNAGTVGAADATTSMQPITGFGGQGQVVMNRVDYIHFLLGTQDAQGNMVYYTIKDYKALAKANNTSVPVKVTPRILVVKIAALVRSLDNTNSPAVDPTTTYQLYDKTVTPTAETNQNTNRYVRRVYATTVSLRNAMGVAS